MILTKYDYSYKFNDTFGCKAQDDKECGYARGHVLGGTGAMNANFWVKGDEEPYKRFESVHGCTGWTYPEILKYFLKVERNGVYPDSIYHNTKGQVCVNVFDPSPKYFEFWEAAAKEVGIEIVADINGSNTVGVCIVRVQCTCGNGRRASPHKMYLQYIKRFRNYRLVMHARVNRVLFDSNKKAIGVEFERDNVLYNATARKEVIICGGTYESPVLLMRSGIGPRDVLVQNGISVLVDSPNVGKNLADHSGIFTFFVFKNIKTTTSLTEWIANIYKYNQSPRSGLFASVETFSSVSYEPREPGGKPYSQNYHIFFEKNSLILPEFLRIWRYRQEIANEILRHNCQYAVGLVIITNLYPKSRGQVTMKNGKIFIEHRTCSDPQQEDYSNLNKTFLNEMKRLNTKVYQDAGAEFLQFEVCKKYSFLSEEYNRCYLDHFIASMYHPVGTNKMGSQEKGAVIDPQAQVYGVTGLRVADASV